MHEVISMQLIVWTTLLFVTFVHRATEGNFAAIAEAKPGAIMRNVMLLFALILFLVVTNVLHLGYLPFLSIYENEQHLGEYRPESIVSREHSCRVAVTNSKPYHYETLESIAAKMPLRYLNLTTLSCQSIVFDYHIAADGNRHDSWVTYFETSMRGTDVSNLSGAQDGSSDKVRRTIGELVLHYGVNASEILDVSIRSNNTYNAQVEASCYCRDGLAVNNHGERWIQENDSRTCIFHESCPVRLNISSHPRALWVSPHHAQYYIPTIFPRVPKSGRNSTVPKPICVVGATHKREWNYLQQMFNESSTATRGRQIHIYAFGSFPKKLKAYEEFITVYRIKDYREFHEHVAQCGAILFLLKKSKQSDYFLASKQKLTGALPLVLAYNIPVLLHEELYELYKADLPANLPFATHTDELDSFNDAMKTFLDKLDAWDHTQV